MEHCTICEELIGACAPTYRVNTGFGGDDFHTVVVHQDCVEDTDLMELVKRDFEASGKM